jgi:hemerythrin
MNILKHEEIILFQQEKILSYLFLMVNLSTSSSSNVMKVHEIIDALIEYTDIHFKDKEVVLESLANINTHSHSVLHQQLFNQAKVMKNRILNGEDLLPELILFFVNNILIPINQTNNFEITREGVVS